MNAKLIMIRQCPQSIMRCARGESLLLLIVFFFLFSRAGLVTINWAVSMRTLLGVICFATSTREMEWFHRALTKSLFLRIDHFPFFHLSRKCIISSSPAFSSSSRSLWGGVRLFWIADVGSRVRTAHSVLSHWKSMSYEQPIIGE